MWVVFWMCGMGVCTGEGSGGGREGMSGWKEEDKNILSKMTTTTIQ